MSEDNYNSMDNEDLDLDDTLDEDADFDDEQDDADYQDDDQDQDYDQDGDEDADDDVDDEDVDDDVDDDDIDEADEDAPKSKKERKPSKSERKEKARLKKEWEDSIVASKRVKREERRRKWKRILLILLVFSLIVTSVVYVMLLFIQENNVRITASYKNGNKQISLSADNEFWTPYLNVQGPEHIWNVSYNPQYKVGVDGLDPFMRATAPDATAADKAEWYAMIDSGEVVPTTQYVMDMLNANEFKVGTFNGQEFIVFAFLLKNMGDEDVYLDYEMTLENDDRGLQNAVRVMWGETSMKEGPTSSTVTVYASMSHNPRLNGTGINFGRPADQGYFEYIAYPFGADRPGSPSYDLKQFETKDVNELILERRKGYIATTPFASENYVFQNQRLLAKGDIMYFYVCIWLEGSDFDCVNSVLGGYVTLGVNFVAS